MKCEEYETVMKIIKQRRSIRHYKPDVPEKELILKMVDAARYAPSSTNYQPWMFFIITSAEIKEKMARAVSVRLNEIDRTQANRRGVSDEDIREFGRRYFLFFREAPVLIASFFKPYPDPRALGYELNAEGEEKRRLLSIESTSAAVQNMLLAAHSLGLGTCWLDGPLIAREELENILNIEEPWKLLCLVTVGYPRDIPSAVRRRKVEFVTRFIA